MTLGRHARHYLIIGDRAVARRLGRDGRSSATGAWRWSWPTSLGRVAGAMLGYWLNGKLTFAGDETAVGRTQLVRFVADVARHDGGQHAGRWARSTNTSAWSWAWLAKPARGRRAGRDRVRAVAALGLQEVARYARNEKRRHEAGVSSI